MLRKIAWKNIIYKPLNSALCICLLLFGVGIISLLLLIQNQLEGKFQRDLRNVDLVVGAKGSPLQLVLSAIYHLDAPTGNIKLAEARKIMQNREVEEAIPLAYGDSYRGHRILGTTAEFVKKYDGEISEGRMFAKPMEATLGEKVASKFNLSIGDSFLGTHGDVKGGHVHEDDPYTVVGILQRTNSVVDRLILTDVESVWQVHSHDHGSHMSTIDTLHALELDLDYNHDHDHDHAHDHCHSHGKHVMTADSMEITACLLKYKSKMSVLKMPRVINEQTNMQAVLPALEINRLFHMIGIGATTIKLIAGGIMLMAGLSVFFVLLSRLRDRKYELALLRSVGYRPTELFMLLVFEGLFLAILGYALGWLLSRAGIYFINVRAESDFNLSFKGQWVQGEEWVLILTIFLGFVSALIPAWRAMKMDVSSILSKR